MRLYPSWWRHRYSCEFEALLEDVQPGWRELSDVVRGALTMQIKTPVTVVCALAVAIAGGLVAMRTPDVFASSATIRLGRGDIASTEPARAEELRISVDKALAASRGTREATLVSPRRGDSAQTTLKLPFLHSDPAQAQRVAESAGRVVVTTPA